MCIRVSDAGIGAGKEAVPQGDDSLASKLAASPVWLSLTVDADTFPASGLQVICTTVQACVYACCKPSCVGEVPVCQKLYAASAVGVAL